MAEYLDPKTLLTTNVQNIFGKEIEYFPLTQKWKDLKEEDAITDIYIVSSSEIIRSYEISKLESKSKRMTLFSPHTIFAGYMGEKVLEGHKVNYPRAVKSFRFMLESWWSGLSTLEKAKTFPREFLSFSMLGGLFFTVFLLASGIILNRVILAPDFGVVLIIIFSIFWLMTQLAKIDNKKY
ncbi:hypothetical protein ACFL45_02500 [Candidatus Neomarinimicrobiota bacterium]